MTLDATKAGGVASNESCEQMWSMPFLAPRRAEAELLHSSMGEGRREAWYESTILLEAIRQQWYSLAFLQPEAVSQTVAALQRVVKLGFYLGEASRRITAVSALDNERNGTLAESMPVPALR